MGMSKQATKLKSTQKEIQDEKLLNNINRRGDWKKKQVKQCNNK